jgi:hypothetical protein
MTGIASLEHGHFAVCERPFQRAGDKIFATCERYKRVLAVGWERFTILPGTHKLSAQPEALEVIGVARYFAAAYGCMVLQPAQQHTPTKQDQRELKALGWWAPGEDDSQSAACHLLSWMKRENCLPPEHASVLARLR